MDLRLLQAQGEDLFSWEIELNLALDDGAGGAARFIQAAELGGLEDRIQRQGSGDGLIAGIVQAQDEALAVLAALEGGHAQEVAGEAEVALGRRQIPVAFQNADHLFGNGRCGSFPLVLEK